MSNELNAYEAALQRRSMKSFKPDPIPEPLMQKLMDTAWTAPSSFNFQPTRIVIVKDEQKKKALSEASWRQKQILEAPVTFVFAVESKGWEQNIDSIAEQAVKNEAWPPAAAKFIKEAGPQFQKNLRQKGLEREYAIKDAVISATMTALVAESLGLNTCYMNGWDEEGVKKVIGAKEDISIALLLPIGYGAESRKNPGRLPREKVFFPETLK